MRQLPRLLVVAAAIPFVSFAAGAATLCVTSQTTQGCYTHIGDAIAAASAGDTINVASGTYHESVTILKPLTLAGQGATIDATGLSRGVYVDGIDAPLLTGVHVAGFTIENANFEGILVANASSISISGNTIVNNNRSLVSGTCPGLEAFETAEQTDCGEGLHLMGADHVIVTNNTSKQNSGGILISDDTATAHDNLVSFNQVSDNPWACGITMASHIAATMTKSSTPLGVFHNTIYGNHSSSNGLSNGGGAGIGIFASVPGAQSYGNVVVANVVDKNGLPGIAMHAHAPGQVLNDNVLVGNLVLGNGPDTEDAATPGPAGINIYSVSPVTGNIVSGNVVAEESVDVAIKVPALVQVQFNDLLGPNLGVDNLGAGMVDASSNWWGACAIAAIGGCSSNQGPKLQVSPQLLYPIVPLPVF